MATFQSHGSGQEPQRSTPPDAPTPHDALIHTIVRVFVVQIIALALLWFLQSRFGF